MTPTIKQLIERATPGRWIVQYFGPYHDISITTPRAEKRIPIFETVAEPWTSNGMPRERAEANAQLIARCNPEVMLKVVEALESCRWAKVKAAHPEYCMKYDEAKVKAALNLLNHPDHA